MMQEFTQELKRMVGDALEGAHTAIPGVVESFDADACEAAVRPLAKARGPGGAAMDYPELSGVPVLFPCGAWGCLAHPVARGDRCLLVFCERPLDAWRAGGGADAGPGLSHDLSSAVAIPGMHAMPPGAAREAQGSGRAVLWCPGGALVKGGASVEGDLRVAGKLSVNGLDVGSHTHATAGPGEGTGGPR